MRSFRMKRTNRFTNLSFSYGYSYGYKVLNKQAYRCIWKTNFTQKIMAWEWVGITGDYDNQQAKGNGHFKSKANGQ